MRIAMVAACPFPAARGSQVLIECLASDLSALGHQVSLVTYPSENLSSSRTLLGGAWTRMRRNVALGVRLYRVVSTHDIDVIHAHNYEAPICAYVVRWLTDVPVVYHSHNALYDELATYVRGRFAKALARRVGRLLDREVPRRADFAIALTAELERYLVGCGVEPSKVRVCPPGADPHAGVGGSVAAEATSDFIVVYAGNLDPYQDLDVLIRGFADFRAKVQNASLRIVTHEHDWRRRAGWLLEELVEQGVARVVVVPTYAGVAAHMQRADVLVCPRSSWSGYPIKLLNYMTIARPILAAAGSAKGILEGETGLVFGDGDAGHLAAQLERLHADPELRRRLGAAAFAAVRENHDRKKIASEIAKIHARLGCCQSSRPLLGDGQGGRLGKRLKTLLGRRIGSLSSVKTSR